MYKTLKELRQAQQEEFEELQKIRTGHCARKKHNHACEGECTITPTAIKLKCKPCGSLELHFCPGCHTLETVNIPCISRPIYHCPCGQWVYVPVPGTVAAGEWRKVEATD